MDWYDRADGQPISPHSREHDAHAVPGPHRWHLHSGIAHPHHDVSPWGRIPTSPCARPAPPTPAGTFLDDLRRDLATTRRLIKTAPSPAPHPRPPHPCSPVHAIGSVAQTRTRRRCTRHPPPQRAHRGGVAPPPHPPHLTDTLMAVYDLDHLRYAEQLRWRAQRSTTHAALHDTADSALTHWKPFDLGRHRQHVRRQLPDAPPLPGSGHR